MREEIVGCLGLKSIDVGILNAVEYYTRRLVEPKHAKEELASR